MLTCERIFGIKRLQSANHLLSENKTRQKKKKKKKKNNNNNNNNDNNHSNIGNVCRRYHRDVFGFFLD